MVSEIVTRTGGGQKSADRDRQGDNEGTQKDKVELSQHRRFSRNKFIGYVMNSGTLLTKSLILVPILFPSNQTREMLVYPNKC